MSPWCRPWPLAGSRATRQSPGRGSSSDDVPCPRCWLGCQKSRAVVGNGKRSLFLVGRKADHDLVAVAVFDGIVDRLARDVIKMRGHRVVMNQHRGKTLEAAGNPKQN